MKALIYNGPGSITYESVDDPKPEGVDGAVIKITLCGICGSDLHPYHVDTGHAGYCIGHEAVGEVVEVGSGVTKFAVGDRVYLPGSLSCGECSACRNNNEAICERYGMRVYGQGLPTLGGCQAEAVAVPGADLNLRRLGDGVSDKVGLMMTDNLATAWFGARLAGVGPGDTVAVIGLGSVGLQAVLSAQAQGAELVFAIDLIPERRAAAAAMGAHPVEHSDPVEAILELTDGKGVNAVIDASGGPKTTPMAVELIRKGGKVSVVGVSEHPVIDFPIQTALRKNLSFAIGVCSIQGQLTDLEEAMADGRLSSQTLESIISHTMPLSAGSEAYRLFDSREDNVSKVALDPSL